MSHRAVNLSSTPVSKACQLWDLLPLLRSTKIKLSTPDKLWSSEASLAAVKVMTSETVAWGPKHWGERGEPMPALNLVLQMPTQ